MSHLRPYNNLLKASYFTDEEAKSIHCGKFKLFDVALEDQAFVNNIQNDYATQIAYFFQSRTLSVRDVLTLSETCKTLYNLIQPRQSLLKLEDCLHGRVLLSVMRKNPTLHFPLFFFEMKRTGTEYVNAPFLDPLSATMLERANPYLKDMRSVCIGQHRSLWDETIFSQLSGTYHTASEVYIENLESVTQANCDLITKSFPELKSVYVHYRVDIQERGQYQAALQALLRRQLSEEATKLPFTFQFAQEEISFEEVVSILSQFPNLQAIDSTVKFTTPDSFSRYAQNPHHYPFIQSISINESVPQTDWLSFIEKTNLKKVRCHETLNENYLEVLNPLLAKLDPSEPCTISNLPCLKIAFQIKTPSGKECQIQYKFFTENGRKIALLRSRFEMAAAQAPEDQNPAPQPEEPTENNSDLNNSFLIPEDISSPNLSTLHINGTGLKTTSPIAQTLVTISERFPNLHTLKMRNFIGPEPERKSEAPPFKNLTSFTVKSIRYVRAEALQYCLQTMPHLKSFTAKRLEAYILGELSQPLPTLKHVRLYDFKIGSADLSKFLVQVPHLETLILDNNKKNELIDLNFRNHGAELTKLSRVELRSLKRITEEHIAQLITQVPSLRELTISHCKQINDDTLEALCIKAHAINPALVILK